MAYTILACLRTDQVPKSGICNIIIRIILNRKVVHTEKTGKSIPPDEWDSDRRQVKASYPNARLYNIGIARRIHEMESQLVAVELQGRKLTQLMVKRILSGKDAGYDFFEYCMQYIPVKYCEARQKETRRSYFGEVTKLKKYRSALNFYDLDQRFLTEYRAYMLTELQNHPNTVWKSFKFIKTMVNAALKEGKFTGANPFNNFDIGKYRQGVRDYLELSDCLEIKKVLDSNVPEMVRTVGYYYLFMCYSGLRYSDAMRFNPAVHILNDEEICMVTHKKQVPVTLFIHGRLREVIDYIRLHPLKLVNKEFNKYLKVLGTLANISIPLTAHIGRHTFGAMLAEMEIPKEAAQKLLGHSDIRSTSVYYHLKDKNLRRAMEKWDSL